MFIGLIFFLIGCLWLLSALGIITADISEIIWPIIFITVGLVLILKKEGHLSHCCWTRKQEKQEKK